MILKFICVISPLQFWDMRLASDWLAKNKELRAGYKRKRSKVAEHPERRRLSGLPFEHKKPDRRARRAKEFFSIFDEIGKDAFRTHYHCVPCVCPVTQLIEGSSMTISKPTFTHPRFKIDWVSALDTDAQKRVNNLTKKVMTLSE